MYVFYFLVQLSTDHKHIYHEMWLTCNNLLDIAIIKMNFDCTIVVVLFAGYCRQAS